jgi:hypothetical protein
LTGISYLWSEWIGGVKPPYIEPAIHIHEDVLDLTEESAE